MEIMLDKMKIRNITHVFKNIELEEYMREQLADVRLAGTRQAV